MKNLEKTSFGFWRLGVFLFVLLIALDQITKEYVNNFFCNYQFAFSLPLPLWLIYTIYLAAIGSVFIYCYQNFWKFNNGQILAWLLILAGAISNIGERLMNGYVKDFIYITFYRWTGIYNFADGYIILGIIILFFSAKSSFNKTPGDDNELGSKN